MRRALLGLALTSVAVAGCQSVDVNPHRTSGTGSGNPSEPDIDASVPDAGPISVSGRVCMVDSDLLPDTCMDGVEGATVTVRGGDAVTATTAADGTFTLDGVVLPVTVVVSATSYHDSVIDVDTASGTRLPLISEVDWQQLLTNLGATQLEGDASAVLAFVDGDAPLAGAQVLTAPAGTIYPVFYDQNAGVLTFDTDTGTGTRGLALLIDVPTVDLAVTADVQAAATDDNFLVDMPVEPDALTFHTIPR